MGGEAARGRRKGGKIAKRGIEMYNRWRDGMRYCLEADIFNGSMRCCLSNGEWGKAWIWRVCEGGISFWRTIAVG